MGLIFVGIIVLAFIGVPLFVLFGGGSLVLFMSLPEGAWASAAIDVFGSTFAESPSLMTIPLFTFAGFLLAESRAPLRLIDWSRAWFGWMPGGLAIVCLMVSTFFATFTGGSGVTIVAVGGLLYPALVKEKYPDDFSIGLITTAGALGGMFPPSVLLIFYGIVAGLVMDKILVAGIGGGLLSTFALMAYCSYAGFKAKVPTTRFNVREAWRASWVAKWELAIPIVLIGGLITGLFRFHEASAFTAVYVLLIEVFVYKDIKIRKDLPRIVIESMTMLGAVLIILATAVGFTGWMIQAQVPTLIFDFMDDHIHTRIGFLLALNIFLVLIGMFTDGVTAILVIVPLIIPLGVAYNVDPYHMAAIFLLNLEMGFLIPPVGMNLFISSIRFAKSVGYVCRAVLPTLAVLTVTLGLVTYVPEISTWMPNMIEVPDDEVVSLGGGYVQFKDEGAAGGAAGAAADPGGDDEGAMSDEELEAMLAGDGGVDGGVDGGALAPAEGAEPAAAEPEPAPEEKKPAAKPKAKAKAKAAAKHKH